MLWTCFVVSHAFVEEIVTRQMILSDYHGVTIPAAYPHDISCVRSRTNKATSRTRTGDLRFTKPLLYQLS